MQKEKKGAEQSVIDISYGEEKQYFGEVLSAWLVSVRLGLKPTTHAAYETILMRHIRPELHGYTPAEVTDAAVERFLRGKADEGLSLSTLRSISCVLRAAVRYGQKYGCAARAETCRVAAARKKNSISILSDDERRAIVSAIGKQPRERDLGVLISLYTGLRVGEVCGLKWGDISRESRCLNVKRTVSRIRRSGAGSARTTLYVGEPKSYDSCRKIPLPKALVGLLEQARETDDCFVLSGRPDKITEPRSMQRHFSRLLRKAGVEHVNYHALRHSFATQCVDLGFDVKVLSMILGHSDVGITLNTYVHPSFERMRSMMELLE